ncbi:hypothetical protein [Alkalicoccobacillus murimartini]|uniref:Uncharacterized protein n=1 Tax=Alkalicoccobacillus murimartini TaxID=171685 RepID=A0ABT9YJ59_9BACI|nr:hypothetical protein [Alkalicoccobacillus murimartini]MDQ0207893.1 hypothetical protein [Alkalicoccobacillus murimartini]
MKNKEKAKQQKKKKDMLKDLLKKNVDNWKKGTAKSPSPHSYNKFSA